jgi:hypothetical protein
MIRSILLANEERFSKISVSFFRSQEFSRIDLIKNTNQFDIQDSGRIHCFKMANCSAFEADQRALQLGILLSVQESEFGINMLEAVTNRDRDEVNIYMRQGCSENEAKLLIFENRYVFGKNNFMSQVSSLSPRQINHSPSPRSPLSLNNPIHHFPHHYPSHHRRVNSYEPVLVDDIFNCSQYSVHISRHKLSNLSDSFLSQIGSASSTLKKEKRVSFDLRPYGEGARPSTPPLTFLVPRTDEQSQCNNNTFQSRLIDIIVFFSGGRDSRDAS